MNAYFLIAEMSHIIRAQSFLSSIIILGAPEPEAITLFQAHLEKSYANPADPLQIESIDAIALFDSVLSETGPQPLDSLIASVSSPEEAPAEEEPGDMGAGWWADCEQLVPPDNLAPDVESFRRGLPADVESELNWKEEKKHTFLVRILRRCEEDQPLAALVQARNAPMAAWIWRRNAQGTPLSHNPIQVEPSCPVVKKEV